MRGGASRRCAARALGRSHDGLGPLGKEKVVIFEFLEEHSEAPTSLEQLRSYIFFQMSSSEAQPLALTRIF